jgi:hypothetical protein
MKSDKSFAQFFKWAQPLIASAEGRAQLAGALKELTGGSRKNAEEEMVHQAVSLLSRPNFNSSTLAALQGLVAKAAELTGTTQEELNAVTENTNPDIERIREMNRITADREGREALQRAATGQALDARQTAIVQRYRELEQANNEIARHEDKIKNGAGGTMKISRPHYVAPELYALNKIQDPRERIHAIRALKSQWRDDPQSHYNNQKSPEHKNAIEWMSRLYQEEEALGKLPEDLE